MVKKKTYKTMIEYEGMKFTNRAALEKYLVTYKGFIYEEARNISGNAPKIRVEVIKPVKKKKGR